MFEVSQMLRDHPILLQTPKAEKSPPGACKTELSLNFLRETIVGANLGTAQ